MQRVPAAVASSSLPSDAGHASVEGETRLSATLDPELVAHSANLKTDGVAPAMQASTLGLGHPNMQAAGLLTSVEAPSQLGSASVCSRCKQHPTSNRRFRTRAWPAAWRRCLLASSALSLLVSPSRYVFALSPLTNKAGRTREFHPSKAAHSLSFMQWPTFCNCGKTHWLQLPPQKKV